MFDDNRVHIWRVIQYLLFHLDGFHLITPHREISRDNVAINRPAHKRARALAYPDELHDQFLDILPLLSSDSFGNNVR